MSKVTVVGAGNVGATVANVLAHKDIVNEIVLLDIKDSFAKGKALDSWQQAPIDYYSSRITGTGDYADTKGSDIVVITAGIPRKPGMSRDDLISTNAKIANPTPPPTVLPCTLPMIGFVHFRMALITFANPEKNCFPSSRFVIATSSSKDAPAQNARSPSDLRMITDTNVSSDNSSKALANLANNSEGKELLAWWPNSIVAMVFSV